VSTYTATLHNSFYNYKQLDFKTKDLGLLEIDFMQKLAGLVGRLHIIEPRSLSTFNYFDLYITIIADA